MNPAQDVNYTTYTPEEIKKMKELGKLVINAQGDEKRVYPNVDTPIPAGVVRPEATSYKEAVEWNKLHQQHTERAMIFTQEYASVKIEPKGNKALIICLADLHFGHLDVDYDLLDKLMNMIEHTPDTYCVLGWNLLDAAIPSQFPDGLLWSGMSAQEQVYTFRDKLLDLSNKGKLLGGLGDSQCHEGWMNKRAGWMVYRELFRDIPAPLLVNGGYLDISLGGETYRTALFHKTRYWSTLNKSHGGQRMMDRIADAEIVFTSHMHRASTEQSQRYNPPFTKDTAIVASGTMKLKDRWLRGHLGEEGERGGQGIMLWGDKHKFQTVYDFEIGRELMIDGIKEQDQQKIEALRGELAKLK